MRAVLFTLSLLVSLAACVPTPDPQPPAITESSLPPLNGDGIEPAAPADETPAAEPAPPPPPDPPMLAQQRTACQREGGQLMPRGSGFFACVRPTRDGGRHCTAARDCEGLCLARSSTCAPLHPLFGCQDVFTLPGRRETLCTD